MRINFSYVIRAPCGHREPTTPPIGIFDFDEDNRWASIITAVVKIQCTPSVIFRRPEEKLCLYLDAEGPRFDKLV
jgi:hypothetical protein